MDVVFQNARILDVRAGGLREGAVRVADGRIAEVSDSNLKHAAEREIDLRGRVLMPGLIDAHVHAILTTLDVSVLEHRSVTLLSQEARVRLEAMARRGFTTVRDAGGADHGLAQAVERGLIKGPRLFFSGKVLSQTGGHGDFRPFGSGNDPCGCEIFTGLFSRVADGVPAVRRAAREELRRGATQIKVMASGGVASPSDPVWNVQYSREEMTAIVEESRAWRTYTMAHAYTPEAITHAVTAGVRTIEHGNLIDAASARVMAEHGAFLVPTLVTYFAIKELGRSLGFPEVSLRKLEDVVHAGLGSLEIARAAGVELGFGTDLLGETHDQQSREFRIRAEVERPIDVLRSATLINARILNREGELGEIAVGARADLVVVDGDPLTDLSLLEGEGKHLPLVLKDGEPLVDRI